MSKYKLVMYIAASHTMGKSDKPRAGGETAETAAIKKAKAAIILRDWMRTLACVNLLPNPIMQMSPTHANTADVTNAIRMAVVDTAHVLTTKTRGKHVSQACNMNWIAVDCGHSSQAMPK